MAVLTTGSAITPFASQWRNNGVTIRHFSGAGVTITEIAAGVAAKRHVIIGGRVSFEAAGGLDICSAATVLDQVEFIARGTAFMPVGLECVTAEALQITNADAATVRGWVAYATIADDQYCPLL